MKCDSCGEPATHVRDNCDIGDTDRGDEYRFYSEALCDDCDPETAKEKSRNEFSDWFTAQYLGITNAYLRGRR